MLPHYQIIMNKKKNEYSKPTALDKEVYVIQNKSIKLTFIPNVDDLEQNQELAVLEENDLYDMLQVSDLKLDAISLTNNLIKDLETINRKMKMKKFGPKYGLQEASDVSQKFIDICMKSARYNAYLELIEKKRKNEDLKKARVATENIF